MALFCECNNIGFYDVKNNFPISILLSIPLIDLTGHLMKMVDQTFFSVVLYSSWFCHEKRVKTLEINDFEWRLPIELTVTFPKDTIFLSQGYIWLRLILISGSQKIF